MTNPPCAACGLAASGAKVLARFLENPQKSCKRGSCSYLLFYPFFRAELAASLGAMGRIDDGVAEIDGALRFAEETDYRWFLPEILRVKGELLARRGSEDPAVTAELFVRSLEQARDQQALYWELRAGISLAEALQRQHKPDAAREILSPIYNRFTEGFSVPMMRHAKRLLSDLR